MADLELINGPTNIYEGPATGLSTEKGDSWHVAVGKINAAITHVGHAIEGIGEGMDGSVVDRLSALEEAVAVLQQKMDSLLDPTGRSAPALEPVTIDAVATEVTES